MSDAKTAPDILAVVKAADQFSRDFNESLHAALKHNGPKVTPVQLLMLHAIHEGHNRPVDILTHGISQGTNASYSLKCLTKDGYLVRRNGTDGDQRASVFHLTNRGRQAVDWFCNYLSRIETRMTAPSDGMLHELDLTARSAFRLRGEIPE